MTAPADLPVVPPLKSAHSCRRCRRWLEGEWAQEHTGERRPEVLDAIQRQMDAGRCDDCTRRETAGLVQAAKDASGVGTVEPGAGLRFASCDACGREMSGTRCSIAVRIIGVRPFVRRPYEKLYAFMADNCNDCNAPLGGMHHPGCDQDRCPVDDCHSQAAFCEHQDQGWPE